MDEILKWLGGLSAETAGSGLLSVLVSAVVAGAVKGWRESKRATERMKSIKPTQPPASGMQEDEPATRQLTTGTVPEDESLEERAAFLAKRVAALLVRCEQQAAALREAAALSEARERALERAKRELQADLDAVRGDLVVARNRILRLEAAGAELAGRLREVHGEPAPRTPGSATAVTRRPPKP